ncbi:MAG: ATPase, T2SS/T4P/T4SS family [Planctomycetota bacterium]
MEAVAVVLLVVVGAVALGVRPRRRTPAPAPRAPIHVAPPPPVARASRRLGREPSLPRDLGEVLVEAGVITAAERARAERIRLRLERPRWLGDVLIDLGYCVRAGIYQACDERGLSLPPGEQLLRQGAIDEAALQAAWTALGDQAEDSSALEAWLCAAGHLSATGRLEALAGRMGVPFVDPTTRADPAVLGRLPARYLEAARVVPLAVEGGAVRVAVGDPERFALAGELEAALGAPVRFALATPGWIESQLTGRGMADERSPAPNVAPLPQDSDAREVAERCVDLVREAVRRRATDLHLEPRGDGFGVRLRIDGVLAPAEPLPRALGERLVRHLRVLADCGGPGHQRGRFTLDLGELDLELRLSTYVSTQGEAAVVRLVLPSRGRGLDELGLSPAQRGRLGGLLRRTSGVVLFAGPTGAGCSTTLYAALSELQGPGVNVTAERAVDRTLEGVLQCRLDPRERRDMAATLRALLAQDPDVIALSQVEDSASAEACMQAALTGHAVYSTIHAEDSLAALIRLGHFDLDAYMLSSTVSAVVAQRLVRKLCLECRQPDSVLSAGHAEHLERAGIARDHFQGRTVYRAKGCEACDGTGYSGRCGIFELLVCDERIRDLLLSGASPQHLRRHVQDRLDHRTLLEDGLERVAEGLTSVDEVLRVAPHGAPPRPLLHSSASHARVFEEV